jgi:hypothetical protein
MAVAPAPEYRLRAALAWLALLAAAFVPAPARGEPELVPAAYYWYVPEHEKQMRTEFFSMPSFRSQQVKVVQTRRFRFVGAQRNWAQLEFDGSTRAFIHLRILRMLLYDATAIDPWYEFQRASVFPEEPDKIEARLKPKEPEPPAADSRVPVWKRYKDSWSINRDKARPGSSEPYGAASRPEKKPRSNYPLLPPIGSQPGEGEAKEPPAADSGSASSMP